MTNCYQFCHIFDTLWLKMIPKVSEENEYSPRAARRTRNFFQVCCWVPFGFGPYGAGSLGQKSFYRTDHIVDNFLYLPMKSKLWYRKFLTSSKKQTLDLVQNPVGFSVTASVSLQALKESISNWLGFLTKFLWTKAPLGLASVTVRPPRKSFKMEYLAYFLSLLIDIVY